MATSKNLKLGKFYQDENGMLRGTIAALGIGFNSVISEEAKSQEGKPYLKLIADPLGVPFEVGAAFPKEKDGMNYYSVSLESPLLLAPLHAALFPDKENTASFNLVWSRPEPRYGLDVAADGPQGRRYIGAGATP